ncbi:hypothetical protein GCM10011395_24870 [Sphingomonas psychrolutea]|uniref:Uncharacterized protein n=1 Tax=Sphingomonas psychrolutea TaxID=1259676 RepID=A0ABQ1GZT9_9SPHN|nr:hypothetical protein GCM10011395_24870 [Sphingomonas psychrolutea]
MRTWAYITFKNAVPPAGQKYLYPTHGEPSAGKKRQLCEERAAVNRHGAIELGESVAETP